MNLFKTGAGWVLFCFLTFVHLSAVANAAELRAARVTQIINDVKLLPRQAAARAAVVNDNVGAGTAVRTGVDSRTELTFSDLTITRLGANTGFSFNEGARQVDLGSGAILVQVPRNEAEVKIRTAAVTAAITGGTALFESHRGLPTKLLMLEGIGRFYPTGHPEQAVIVHGGEMVMMTVDGKITRPTKFNAALVYKTSKLITSFPELANADLILAVIDEQQAELSSQNGPESLPIPGFLFAALQLDGDPTVSNSSGYTTLGLVSQGNINTSASETVFTFGGMQQVGLIALNGSINLSGISFANFGELFIYARGAGSSVTFAAPVSNLNRVQIRAEGDIQVDSPVTVNGTQQDHRGFKALAGNNLVVNSTVNSTGGGITLQSLGGIVISSSAQLQTVLDAIGSSGQIIILASGSDTSVNVGGTVQAQQAEVDIRQTGVAGQTTLNNATVHGDVVKISALGTNGALNIGSGNVLGADTILKLYATGSNGTLNFLSNVTLTSPSNILAANTINISQGVIVTINSVQPADVFTNNPNYFGFGGTGTPTNSGTFGGTGAKNPLPLSAAPPLGGPGQGP